MLIEAAWSYRYPARIAKEKAEILVRLPKNILQTIVAAVPVRLMKRDLLFIAEQMLPLAALAVAVVLGFQHIRAGVADRTQVR